MKKYIYILIVAAIVVLVAVHPKSKTYSSPDEMVAEALSEVTLITPAELKKITEGEDVYTIVDVRSKTEHYHGYIPGAMVISRGSLEFNIGSAAFWEGEGLYLPEKDEKIILYCKKGSRSILAASSIQKLGYTNIVVLEGGWKNWELAYPNDFEKNLEMLSGGNTDHASAGGC
jgi:rhodanese-related sulfurtransferase